LKAWGDDIHETENAQLQEDNPVPAAAAAAAESENREEGEIRSEGEDVRDVDDDLRELIARNVQNRSLCPLFLVNLKSPPI
jgi:hypothetical protein